MANTWTVQEAKAKLSRLLALARAGKPQHIGVEEQCVVVSESDWASRANESLGEWLVTSAPRGEPIEAPSRASRRGDPFSQKSTSAKPKNRKR